jgi:hypothetical protein
MVQVRSDVAPHRGKLYVSNQNMGCPPDAQKERDTKVDINARSYKTAVNDGATRVTNVTSKSSISQSKYAHELPRLDASTAAPPLSITRKVALGANMHAELECKKSHSTGGREMTDKERHHSSTSASNVNHVAAHRVHLRNNENIQDNFRQDLSPIHLRSSDDGLGTGSQFQHTSDRDLLSSSDSEDAVHAVQDFERRYIRAWCQTHRIQSLHYEDSVIDGNDDEYCRLVELYLFDKLKLRKGLKEFSLVNRWNAYKARGYRPERYFGNLNPVLNKTVDKSKGLPNKKQQPIIPSQRTICFNKKRQ